MNEQQLAVVKQAIEILKSCNPENEPLYEQVCAYELAASKSITGLQSIISQDALDKKAENARELGLSYDDEPKIGCVNHDCDKCKAAQPAVPLTDDQVDAAIKAWFENDIVAGRNPFEKRMRAAFAAAHKITEKDD